MRIIIFGNTGSGKSTLAKRLAARHPAALLSLDELAFDGGTDRRPLQDSVADARRFIAAHDDWILEGCYADIIEPMLAACDELVFLNPGVESCIAHCLARPWEPEKFSSKAEQDAHLDHLIAWARDYETRTDEYGLRRHRALYEAFEGNKREFNEPAQYNVEAAYR